MELQHLYKTALALHYLGFVILVGTFVAGYAADRQFWKLAGTDWQKAIVLRQATARFPALIAMGAVLLLAGGITMVVMVHGTVKPQLWFPIKLLIVLIAALNGGVVGGRLARRLKRIISDHPMAQPPAGQLRPVKKWQNVFYISQLVLFLAVFILSAFRFS